MVTGAIKAQRRAVVSAPLCISRVTVLHDDAGGPSRTVRALTELPSKLEPLFLATSATCLERKTSLPTLRFLKGSFQGMTTSPCEDKPSKNRHPKAVHPRPSLVLERFLKKKENSHSRVQSWRNPEARSISPGPSSFSGLGTEVVLVLSVYFGFQESSAERFPHSTARWATTTDALRMFERWFETLRSLIYHAIRSR